LTPCKVFSLILHPHFIDDILKELQVMKVFRMALIVLTISFTVFTTRAQTRFMTTNANPSAQPPVAANPIAVINSGMFSDEKAGISRVNAAMDQVDAKFDPIRKEINGMRDRLNTMRTDIQKKQATQAANVTAQQSDAASQLELQIKRKAEDAQSDFQKQLGAALQPLQADINTALKAYAQAHGILLIIDSNRVPMIYVHDSIDITQDFIAEYNRTHAAVGTPAPKRP
jgi:outer membrane protein